MIRTLVVDDDYRVAEINSAYVERVAGFEVCGRAHTAKAALEAAETRDPDLILLDLYLPDQHGLDLLRRLRTMPDPPDVIVITAARDVPTVRASMQLGAVHYLVKPFTFDRLAEQLRAYRSLRESAGTLEEASQDDVDRLYQIMRTAPRGGPQLPKGASEETVNLVLDALRSTEEPITAAEVGDRVGLSRATAQRYLAYLLERGLVHRHLQYGTAGRPAHRYSSR